MSRIAALTVSLLLLLAAFPLVSIGTTAGPPVLWWLGLAALVLGGLIPPVRRFVTQRQQTERARPCGMSDDARVS